MATMRDDRLVDDYLRHLEGAAAILPSHRRSELVADIREHVRNALHEGGSTDEAAVRNVLERLGPPEDIVAEAVAGDAPGAAAPRRTGPLEVIGLAFLAIGGFGLGSAFGFVGGIGVIGGIVLVLISSVWSFREKLIGLVLPLAAAFVVFFATSLGVLELLVLGGLPGLLATVYLTLRLRTRRV